MEMEFIDGSDPRLYCIVSITECEHSYKDNRDVNVFMIKYIHIALIWNVLFISIIFLFQVSRKVFPEFLVSSLNII